MEKLPMNIKNNIFFKIKKFFMKIFSKKIAEQNQCDKNKQEYMEKKRAFQDYIKAIVDEKKSLDKMDRQTRRSDLLKKVAENQEIIENLTMEELVKLEEMYDEELKKMKQGA